MYQSTRGAMTLLAALCLLLAGCTTNPYKAPADAAAPPSAVCMLLPAGGRAADGHRGKTTRVDSG